MNKFIKLTLLFLFCAVQPFSAQKYFITPLPHSVTEKIGVFPLTDEVSIEADPVLSNEVVYLKALLEVNYNIHLTDKSSKIIKITLEDKLLVGNQSGYILSVNEESVVIKASTPEGVFYAIQTLRQLIEIQSSKAIIPCIEISDYPHYAWRGMMLDEGRYFKGKETVKTLLAEMAKLKLNVFHWHLTDDQGWRIEIKKYPLLTKIGSKRDSTQTNNGYDWPWIHNKWDGKPHAGFYTQKEIKEIIDYAEKLHITIVPEIEILTHTTAAIASYPYLGTTGKKVSVACNLGVMDEVMDPSNPASMEFIYDVLDEVAALFPGKYIHVGGDELLGDHWKMSESVRELKNALKITEDYELQIWFFNQISWYLKNKGKNMIGWSDFIGKHNKPSKMKVNMAEGTIAQYWQGDYNDLKYCLEHPLNVLQSHTDFAYFNASIPQIYKRELVPMQLPSELKVKVLGISAASWSEFNATPEQTYKHIFPRIAAYAELGWTDEKQRDYDNFTKRLKKLCSKWKAQKLPIGEFKN